jgi:hypothetical protein
MTMNAATPTATLERPWLKAYPPGVPTDIDTSQYQSLVGLMEESFKKNSSQPHWPPICKAWAWPRATA